MTRCLSIFLLLAGALHAADPTAGYLMGYFTESPKGAGNSPALHLATSEDGLDWMPLNQNDPILTPKLGNKTLHDPFFLRKPDGGFVVLATHLGAAAEIHVWDTADFVSFTNARLLKLHDVPIPALAPEAFFDPVSKQYGIVWTGNTDYHRTYINRTADFATVTPAEVLFDPGHDVRDATLWHDPARGSFLYYLDGPDNRLHGTRSATLSPRSFEPVSYAKPPGKDTFEAPLVMKAPGENHWFLYAHSNGRFNAWRTGDIARDHWQEIDRRDYNLPPNARHATVIPITRAEMDLLITRWGSPRWNRLKPWNFPGHFVRHEKHSGWISAYPFDPFEDSQWTLTVGLADRDGVSFESVNAPGHFLRAVAGHIVLSRNDGSAAFRAKATFVKVPGLADSTWSSFRSLTSPDLYLRHWHFHVRLDAMTTPLDREDATFRIVY